MIKGSPADQTLNINNHDSLHIQDDSPTFLFGPRATERNEYVPTNYVNFKFHDMVLHNAMLDSVDSHNLIRMIVMDTLGLDITRPYKDLFSFHS